ncbi:SDR family NAD(P)-dependent oxidoreductase [Nocardia gipuzkoensis]|uniref:SDR family NAD(P)-dependent oxidoreductase n=1 Tax=Nocardia gipuzkoensis TaxID=2749991 RepID=UPI0015EEC68E|nr:SDR family oxidoreductase [Nocardia gipuzkoensis]
MSKPVDGVPADEPLSGKTALVTAAYTGIGRSVAKTLAAQGAQVVIQHPHFPEPAAEVVKEITEAGGKALALAADIADRTEYEELVQALLEECGGWHLLVNTAAVPESEPFPKLSSEGFDSGVAAPVKGVFHGLQLALTHLADEGRVINVCDPADPGSAVHDATRGAVEQLGQAVAPDFVPRRITVNTVSYGAGTTDNAELEVALAAISPAEPAAVVAYLASDAASTVNAQVIRLDGTGKPPQ